MPNAARSWRAVLLCAPALRPRAGVRLLPPHRCRHRQDVRGPRATVRSPPCLRAASCRCCYGHCRTSRGGRGDIAEDSDPEPAAVRTHCNANARRRRGLSRGCAHARLWRVADQTAADA
eukprot:Amastigsp_a677400_7.p5 type:complete len:119 gc:universal Amastigsp_a677400_7:657-1013(+)